MRVGVTGGAGFIGSHVTAALAAGGHDPVVFDHKGRGHVGDVMLGDVRDRVAVVELAAHVDALIHLAAVLGTQETVGNPWPAAETNILGTVNVLDAARQYDLPVVYIGVGNWQMHNTYSTTKTAAERLVRQYATEFNLAAAVVRPMNAYGPGQAVAAPFGPGKVRKITPAFVCRALSNMPLEIYGDGSQVSDMVHVTDVAATLVAALEHAARGDVPAHPVEVGPVESVTVLHVANVVLDTVEARTGQRPPIQHLPMRPGEMTGGALPAAMVDLVVGFLEGLGVDGRVARQTARPLSNRVNADTATLTQVGVDPARFVPLADGIAETVDWFAANEGITWRR